MGGQLGLGFLRAERTWQLVHSRFVDLGVGADLAFGPAPMQPRETRSPGDASPAGALPILLAIKPLESLSIVGIAGPAYWGAAGLQYGAGLELSLSAGVSLRPHFSLLQALEPERISSRYAIPSVLAGLDLAFR